MTSGRSVDVAINIFAKPYATSLSVLTLLRHSDRHIDRIHLQYEPCGSMYDEALPYVIAEYLGDRATITQPRYWLQLDATDVTRLGDPEYRMSIRYQHAFETSDKQYLFVMHNDVLIKRDIIGAMLSGIGDAFAIGQIGQCWNCPAAKADAVRAAGLGDRACTPGAYRDFTPDFAGLRRLYEEARKLDIFVRPYWEGWDKHYGGQAWPLPECRVSEWGCLVNLALARPHVAPVGDILPFGSFEQCGKLCLDTAVAWFRELNRIGLHAKHMDIKPYLTHWVGTGKMTSYRYLRAEDNARKLLEKGFPAFVDWCRKKGNKMFR